MKNWATKKRELTGLQCFGLVTFSTTLLLVFVLPDRYMGLGGIIYLGIVAYGVVNFEQLALWVKTTKYEQIFTDVVIVMYATITIFNSVTIRMLVWGRL